MNLTTDRAQGVAIVRVGETRLMYPLLADFSGAVMALLTGGDKKVMIDLSKVTYVDSATIGCLMDLYRQTTAAGGELRLSGVNKRVETMLTMTGAHTAWLHEMLQAAVHSIYSRLGMALMLRSRWGGASSGPSGSFSGQSPQKLEPP